MSSINITLWFGAQLEFDPQVSLRNHSRRWGRF